MTSPGNYILIVEDEAKIAELLVDYLQQSSFETHWISRGDEVSDWVRQNSPDLILLDLMLPGIDGISVCKELRMFSEVPIVMVTARVDEIDRLLGLELGADDYICKPFSPREVVARVKAILRRAAMYKHSATTDVDELQIDQEKLEARVNNRSLDLTPVEFRLLSKLAEQPGRVYSRNQLMDDIYLDGRVVSDRTVDSHIKNLRHKIQSVGGRDDMVRSIYGVGYKLD